MTFNLINKLSWIIDTIRKYRMISFDDLNEKWIENMNLSDGKPISKRTFHFWKEKIEEIFHLQIKCDRMSFYQYYIENIEELKDNSIEKWLLSTYSVMNSLSNYHYIKDRIIFENIPSGELFLEDMVKALTECQKIRLIYKPYSSAEDRLWIIEPYCIKIFRQRWYVVGNDIGKNRIVTFSLDRIKSLLLLNETFEYPEYFNPKEYFNNYFGIFTNAELNVEHVVLRIDSLQANYIRDVPLVDNGTQIEIKQTDEYSIFELDVCPTFDFMQEILKNFNSIEVIEPESLRENLKEIIEKMYDKYNTVSRYRNVSY